MPRPNRDGKSAAEPNRRKLSVIFLTKFKPDPRKFVVSDTQHRGSCDPPIADKRWCGRVVRFVPGGISRQHYSFGA